MASEIRAVIRFIADDINQLKEAVARLDDEITRHQLRRDQLEFQTVALQARMADWRERYADELQDTTEPDPAFLSDLREVSERSLPIILDVVADHHADIVEVQRTYDELDAAGVAHTEAGVRSALSQMGKGGSWKSLGNGVWQRIQRRQTRSGGSPNVAAPAVSERVLGTFTNHCMKCKEKRQAINVVRRPMKDGRPGLHGECRVCGGNMFKPESKSTPLAVAAGD